MTDSVNREVRVISELSERQEIVRDLIVESRESTDKTMEDGLIASLGYEDDAVIALVLSKLELEDPPFEPTNMDLMWAGAVLDHLDTLGYQVIRKP
jgi:hypothetical protein